MSATLHLQLVIDHRLPAGASPSAFAHAHEVSWKPLAKELMEASGVRVALHYSGAVLDWLEQNDPELIASVHEMVARGQVEVLGGPRHDTVLHSVPARDVQSQIRGHAADIERLLGRSPQGLLLPMGAWDPVVPRTLARADIAYTFVDQRLIVAGGPQPGQGWFVTEREGQPLALFPLDYRLVQLFPWASPKQLLRELYRLAGQGQELVSVQLSASALGVVPGSQRRCWEQRWVFALFRGLRSQGAWLKTALPTELLERQRPSGRVYPAAGLPAEGCMSGMSEAAGLVYERLHRTLARGDDPVLNDAAPWLLGPPWEAALVRHDAANRLHKYGLRVSNQVARLQKRVERSLLPRREWEGLREQLYQGQNALVLDPRAGLRDAGLRHAAWQALTLADGQARRLQGRLDRLQYKIMDSLTEGEDGVEVVSPGQRVLIRPAAGGSVSSLQHWGVGNLVNTFARQRETWFAALEQNARLPTLIQSGRSGGAAVVIDADQTDVGVQEEDTPDEPWPAAPERPPLQGLNDAMLTSDRHRRLLFQDHFLGPQTSLANLLLGQPQETGDFLDAPYQLIRAEREDDGDVVVTLARDGLVSVGRHRRLVRMDKRYRFQPTNDIIQLEYQISNRYQEPIQTRFGVELNLNLDGQIGPQRFLLLGDDPRHVGLQRAGSRSDVRKLSMVFEDLRLRVEVSCSDAAQAYFFPVFSPTRSETTYGRGYQGLCILLVWPMELWGAEQKQIQLMTQTTRIDAP